MQILPFSLTYGAVASLASATYLGVRGDDRFALVALALAVVCLAGRALVAGWRPSLPRGRLPARRTVVAPLFAVLLVTAALGAPLGSSSPVQPATATHECSTTEQLVTFSFGLTGYAADQLVRNGKCTESHRAQAIEDLEQSDANQTHLDIYTAGLQQQAETEARTAVYDNYLNDTESAAWMQAEMAIAEAYQNGSSKAVAKAKARQAIADYYSVKAINLIEASNTSIYGMESLSRIAGNESGLSAGIVYMKTNGGNHPDRPIYGNVRTETATLPNGTETGVAGIQAEGSSVENGNPVVSLLDPYATDYTSQSATSAGWTGSIRISAPDANYETQEVYDMIADHERWNKINNQNDALQSEADVFVNQTWEAYQTGQIGPEDVLSRNTQMFRYGNAALNGSESTYDVTAALSSMGLAAPELNGTGSMVVSYQGTDYNGLLLARNAPNGSWQAGTTYNTSAIDGPVLLATTGGQTLELSGEFTVTDITAETGEQITEVRTKKVVYKTSNTSELLEKMDRILELREEIESREPKAGGGATGGDGGNVLQQLAAALGVSAGLAAVVVLGALLLAIRLYTP
ncbi:hypothetical protein QTL95_09300 [Rhizobium sp. S152]|nr:hypothetical protein [Rhizobium sp. S152]MDM9626092.1 hypothetical protein [Rhizobium sp. S152]